MSASMMTKRKFTEEHKNKISLALSGKNNPMYGRHINIGEKNGQWKGDDVKYHALHGYIKRHLPKPKLCPICNERPPYDVACITGVYNRDLVNWQWQCRTCHMISDGRMEKLHSLGHEKRSEITKKIWSKLSIEERRQRIMKTHNSMSAQERHERAMKGWQTRMKKDLYVNDKLQK